MGPKSYMTSVLIKRDGRQQGDIGGRDASLSCGFQREHDSANKLILDLGLLASRTETKKSYYFKPPTLCDC